MGGGEEGAAPGVAIEVREGFWWHVWAVWGEMGEN